MPKCAYTNKVVRCPKCNGTEVHFRYYTDKTIIFCMKSKCLFSFKTYHPKDERYPEMIEEVPRDYPIYDKEETKNEKD